MPMLAACVSDSLIQCQLAAHHVEEQIPRAPFIEDVTAHVGGDVDAGPALDALQEMMQ